MSGDTEPRSAKRFIANRIAGAIIAISCLLILLAPVRFVAWSHALELASHFQVQYCIVSFAALACLLALKRWRAAVLPLLPLILSGAAILPLFTRGPSAAGVGETLRIFHANVLTSNRQRARVLAEIADHDPDIVVLQEVDESWMTTMAAMRDDYPHVIEAYRTDNFGILLLSRIPLREDEVVRVGRAGVPSASCIIDLNGVDIHLFATHPLPPMSQRRFDLRNDQFAQLIETLSDNRRPLIVIGDLNVTPWSPYYKTLVAGLELRNARNGFGIGATWPAQYPPFMRIPIDHCLITHELAVRDWGVGSDIGSDHLPIIVELAMTERGDV